MIFFLYKLSVLKRSQNEHSWHHENPVEKLFSFRQGEQPYVVDYYSSPSSEVVKPNSLAEGQAVSAYKSMLVPSLIDVNRKLFSNLPMFEST